MMKAAKKSGAVLYALCMLALMPALAAAQQQKQTMLSPAQFASQVLSSSNDIKLINLQAQAAYQVRELARLKLTIPAFNLKIYPFGYDSRRTDTFISQYGFDPALASSNPVVFSGLRQFGIDRAYYTAGTGLEFKTLTPLGGYFGFNLDYFFLVNKDSQDYRQQIKFDFVLTQPLFISNAAADLRPFSNEFKILDDRYAISLIERQEKRNALIKGSYEQAYALITLQKQKTLLEKTVDVLENDLKSVEIRRADSQISQSDADTVKVLLNERRQQLRDITSSYNDLRRVSERMSGVLQDSLVILEENISAENTRRLAENALQTATLTKNSDVRKKNLEYAISSKGIYSKEIDSRPAVTFNLSLQPRYMEDRKNAENFLASFTDFSKHGSTVDMLFTMEFSLPLLTSFERRRRRMLDLLSAESNRLLYEKALEDAQRRLDSIQDTYSDALKKLHEGHLEIKVQKILLQQKKIQFNAGSASRQDLLRQKLQLAQTENKQWQVLKLVLLMRLAILDEKGMPLDELLRASDNQNKILSM